MYYFLEWIIKLDFHLMVGITDKKMFTRNENQFA